MDQNLKMYCRKRKGFFMESRLYTGALNVYISSILIDESIFRFNAGDDKFKIL